MNIHTRMNAQLCALLHLMLWCHMACSPQAKQRKNQRELTLGEPELPASYWPMFQGNIQRTGTRQDTPQIHKTPILAWSVHVGIQGWQNNPIVVKDRVFVGSSGSTWNTHDSKDGVYAMALHDGKILWFIPTDDDVNGVAYSTGMVIATSDDGKVRGIDWGSGIVRWTHITTPKTKVYTQPLIIGNTVFVGTASGLLLALSLHSGKKLWSVQMNGALRGGFSSNGTLIFAASQHGDVGAFSLKGKEVWRHTSINTIIPFSHPKFYATPTYANGLLVLTYVRDTIYGHAAIFALQGHDGKLVWHGDKRNPRFPHGKTQWANLRSSPSLYRNMLTFGEPYTNKVTGLKLMDGSPSMHATMGPCMFQHWASPVQAGDMVYLSRFDGAIYAFDHVWGRAKWRVYLGHIDAAGGSYPEENKTHGDACAWEPQIGKPLWSTPALAQDGSIIAGSGQGYVFKLTRDPKHRKNDKQTFHTKSP